jgi:hypothetical protein
MKNILLILLCTIAFTACKKEKSTFDKIKETSKELKKTAKDVKNAKGMIGGLNEAKELTEKLKDIEPLSNDSWKSWMPEQLKDLKRTSYNLGQGALGNLSSMKLQYKDPSNIQKQFKAEIIDGAGTGSGVAYMYKMKEHMTLDSENERGYKKIYKRGATTIQETFSKQTHGTRTKMEFLMNNRFAVNISANNIEPDELWSYVLAMNFDELKDN